MISINPAASQPAWVLMPNPHPSNLHRNNTRLLLEDYNSHNRGDTCEYHSKHREHIMYFPSGSSGIYNSIFHLSNRLAVATAGVLLLIPPLSSSANAQDGESESYTVVGPRHTERSPIGA